MTHNSREALQISMDYFIPKEITTKLPCFYRITEDIYVKGVSRVLCVSARETPLTPVVKIGG